LLDSLDPPELILAFLITWLIGLTPPILIRMLSRRAATKQSAIAICLALGIVNILIFVALGSTNSSHAVVLIMGFASYWILRRQNFINDGRNVNYVTGNRAAEDEAQNGLDAESVKVDLEKVAETAPASVKIREALIPEPRAIGYSVARLNYRKGLFRIWLLCSLGWASWFLFNAHEQHERLEWFADRIDVAEQRNADPKEHARIAKSNADIERSNLHLRNNRQSIEKNLDDYRRRERAGELTKEERSNPYGRIIANTPLTEHPLLKTPLQELNQLKHQREPIEAERNRLVLLAVGAPLALLVVLMVLSWIAVGFREQSK
jgi:hypothetical protein